MSSKIPLKDKFQQYNRHKTYLKKIRHSSVYCPRYDMLSLNNNLLLHRNYDPKKQLIPKKPSKAIQQIEEEIKIKSIKQKAKDVSNPKWYEQVLRKKQVEEKKFQFQYGLAGVPVATVRQQMNRIYNITRQQWSKQKQSYYSCNLE